MCLRHNGFMNTSSFTGKPPYSIPQGGGIWQQAAVDAARQLAQLLIHQMNQATVLPHKALHIELR
jgi:hypothetical protein